MTLARTPYARISPADIGQVDRELKKLEQMTAGLYVPKVLVAARSPYAVLATDTMLLVDCTAGPITLTFPLAARVDGMAVQVVKSDTSANALTLLGTFSGVVNPKISVQDSGFTVFAMNGAYHVTAFVPYPIVTGESGVVSFIYPYGDVRRYGATGVAGTDARAAFVAADAAAQAGYGNNATVRVPAGTHRIASNLTIASAIAFDVGAIGKPDSGARITFSGPFSAPSSKVFDLSAGGSVAFNPGSGVELIPHWFGAKGDQLTDDVAAIALMMTSAAITGSGVYFRPGVYWVSALTTVPLNVSVRIDEAATIFATASMSAVVQTDYTGEWKQKRISGGGTINGNNLADAGLIVSRPADSDVCDLHLLNPRLVGLQLGHASASSTGYAAMVSRVYVQRDPNLAVVAGSKAFWFYRPTDCKMVHCQGIGYETGVRFDAAGNYLTQVHCWAYPQTAGVFDPSGAGTMLMGFDDAAGGNYLTQCYADTATEYGFRLRGFANVLTACKVYNGNAGGTNNLMIGVFFDQTAGPFATIAGLTVQASSTAGHAILQDVKISGDTNNVLPNLELSGKITSGTITTTVRNHVPVVNVGKTRIGDALTGSDIVVINQGFTTISGLAAITAIGGTNPIREFDISTSASLALQDHIHVTFTPVLPFGVYHHAQVVDTGGGVLVIRVAFYNLSAFNQTLPSTSAAYKIMRMT